MNDAMFPISKLEPGKATPRRIDRKYLTRTPLADPDTMAYSSIIVLNGRIVQTYGNEVWLLDEKTGQIISHHQADKPISQALVGEDGHFYAVGGERVLSLTVPDLKVRWTTPIKGDVKAFTGPQDGYLAIQTHDTDWKNRGYGEVYSLKTDTGKILWHKTSKAHSGGHLVILDGKITVDGWFDRDIYDPATGEKIGGQRVAGDKGGCSYPVFTEDYYIRGLTLHAREDLHTAWASDGARSDCQMPTVPAYGQLHLFGTKCGCSTFMRSGLSSFYPAADITPDPEAARFVQPGVKAPQPDAVKPLAVKSRLVGDWYKGEGFYVGDKGWNWRSIPRDVSEKLEKTMGESFYNTRDRHTKAGKLTVAAPFNANTVTAKKNGKALWTLPLGGRVITHPVIADDRIYVGTADGWVISINIADGRILWQYQAAPAARRIVAVGQTESAWPVAGLTVWEDQLLVAAGRRDSFDDGIHVTALDVKTGQSLWHETIGRPDWKFTSPQQMREEGYSGFGNRQSTHAGPLVANEADTAFYMYGTVPVSPQLRKNPPEPAEVHASSLAQGLRYSIFKFDRRLKLMPDVEGRKPDATGTIDTVTATIAKVPLTTQKQRGSGYVLRLDGYLKVTEAGMYRFGCEAKDEARIYLDGRLIREINYGRWRNQSALIPLEAGLYELRVDYASGQGDTHLDVSWKQDSDQRFQSIPKDALLRMK